MTTLATKKIVIPRFRAPDFALMRTSLAAEV